MDEARRMHLAEAEALRRHCQYFSGLGWALLLQCAVPLAAQMVAVLAVQWLIPELMDSMVFQWALSVLTVYGMGFPVFCLMAWRTPAPPEPTDRKPLGPIRFLQVYLIALALLYLSNIVTLSVLGLIGQLRGNSVTNPVEVIDEYPVILNLLLGCVIAPAAEEFMFRKLLLERLRPYGDRFALMASALCFGLFHGNFNQVLYAAALGLVFGYVALRTGCLWQTILLHALVNSIATGVIPLLSTLGDLGEELMSLLILGSILLGIVFLAVRRRELWFAPGQYGFTTRRTWRLFFENPGVLCFCLLVLLESVSYLLT